MKHYRKGWRALPVIRAMAVLSAVGIITTAVTFAALQSSGNALTGNTIQTATASLKISRDGGTFNDSVQGFDFADIIPGGSAKPANGYSVWLKNVGSTPLALSLTIPTQPTLSGISDLSKVSLTIAEVNSNGGIVSNQILKLSELVAGKVSLPNTMTSGTQRMYKLQVGMDADAVNGSSGSITGLDLSFGGTPQ